MRSKRLLVFLTCIILPCVCVARALHVGGYSCELSTTKRTTPAMSLYLGGQQWYANMNTCDTPFNSTTDHHLIVTNPNNKFVNYYVSEFIPSDIGDYIIIDGRLVWANCDISLQGTGVQYIKTSYRANPNTRVWADFQMASVTNQYYVYGFYAMNDNLCMAMWIGGTGGTSWAECSYNNNSNSGHSSSTTADTNRHQFLMSAKKHVEYFPGVTFSSVSTPSTNNGSSPFGIFSNYQGTKIANMKLYGMKIWNGDTLVHQFVPVPRGLQIGDFTVPQNGLFDIVEQQFYGNSGVNEFGINLTRPDHWVNMGLYTFDTNGDLIDADSSVFLEGSGLEYINTQYVANKNTKVYADYQMNTTKSQQYIFGRWGGSTNSLCLVAYINGSGDQGKWAECSYDLSSGAGHASSTNADTNRHQLVLSVKNHVESWTGATFSSISKTATQSAPGPIGIFSNYGSNGKGSNMRLFRLKIWENDTLMHDFIPVPKGLVINDYTVPSNGLWDIVNQQFYGNSSSTGSFTFGY